MASTSLTRTSSASATKGTLSMWVKRTKTNTSEPNLGSTQYLHHNVTSTSSNYGLIVFDANDQIEMMMTTSGSHTIKRVTNRKFRDTSAWYHFVFVTDVNNSTAQNRMRIYVNGVEETSFSTNDSPSGAANRFYEASASNDHVIGANSSNGVNFDGSMSHVYNIVDTVYTPSAFGSTDSTTGEWKINTSPSVTFGSQGYLILKDGNTITDQSGNSNNFTVAAGTLTKTEDCPDNVFAVYNQLLNIPSSELSNGATTIFNASSASTRPILSSLGASSGKFYAEFKTVTASSASRVGICDMDKYVLTEFTGVNALSYGYLAGGTVANNNSTTISGLSSYTSGDIIGVYIDLDNNFLYFAKNGVLQNSGVPTSGATGTGGQAITANNTYGFHVTVGSSSKKTTANFGNGYFGTTAVSSAGTNASGIGIFEYDVPTGYTALSTKGLNL